MLRMILVILKFMVLHSAEILFSTTKYLSHETPQFSFFLKKNKKQSRNLQQTISRIPSDFNILLAQNTVGIF